MNAKEAAKRFIEGVRGTPDEFAILKGALSVGQCAESRARLRELIDTDMLVHRMQEINMQELNAIRLRAARCS